MHNMIIITAFKRNVICYYVRMADSIVQKPEESDLILKFLDGSMHYTADLPSMKVGKGIYKPGWRWSVHTSSDQSGRDEKHIGYVLSGQMVIKSVSGEEIIIGPGEAFEITPNHDAWVLGNEPCVALDFASKPNINL